MLTVAELRLKVLTYKHIVHKTTLTFLNRSDAKYYVRGAACLLGCLTALLVYVVLSYIWFILAYHSNPVEYLQEYYKPETPRYIDTRDFRTPADKVLDLQSYKEELFKLNQYNTYLSDRTPVNRLHKDPRAESCRRAARKSVKDEDLSTSSIIIVMYNEELSALVRTIVSIMMTSPMTSVKEIIVVDDKSDRYELGDRLKTELGAFSFVKLIRNSKREGLIRSKIIGAKAAIGKILIFLDSHVETMEGWYQPIITRIMEDSKTVVCPVISAVDHTTLQLVVDRYSNLWGAWEWDLTFKWRILPPREVQRRNFDDSKPIRTPAMAGGIFGIDKDFFFKMGGYDSGMQIWGGENLELSFRIWMCGGAIEINTCSYVGHIFRAGSVFSASKTGENVLARNIKRLAEVWLDDYKEVHYHAAPAIKQQDAGDVVSRVLLRQRLNCKSFAWYLREVFPEQELPERDFIAYGRVRGPSEICMDTTGRSAPGQQVGVWGCHGQGGNQFWKFRRDGTIRNEIMCLDADLENPNKVALYECHGLGGNQQWFLAEDGWIRHGGSGQCLSHNGRHLIILKCDYTHKRFKWEFSAINNKQLNIFYDKFSEQFGYHTNAARDAKEKETKTKYEKKLKEREKKRKEDEERKNKEKKDAEERKMREGEESRKRKSDKKMKEKERKRKEERKKKREEEDREDESRIQRETDEDEIKQSDKAKRENKKEKEDKKVDKDVELIEEEGAAHEEDDEELKEFLAWKAKMKASKKKKVIKSLKDEKNDIKSLKVEKKDIKSKKAEKEVIPNEAENESVKVLNNDDDKEVELETKGDENEGVVKDTNVKTNDDSADEDTNVQTNNDSVDDSADDSVDDSVGKSVDDSAEESVDDSVDDSADDSADEDKNNDKIEDELNDT